MGCSPSNARGRQAPPGGPQTVDVLACYEKVCDKKVRWGPGNITGPSALKSGGAGGIYYWPSGPPGMYYGFSGEASGGRDILLVPEHLEGGFRTCQSRHTLLQSSF